MIFGCWCILIVERQDREEGRDGLLARHSWGCTKSHLTTLPDRASEEKLKGDITKINNPPNVFMAADKTRNLYELRSTPSRNTINHWRTTYQQHINNISETCRKAPKIAECDINMKAKNR